ncbi:MAG: heavy metal-binding domain-containing protein [Methylocella sp.]
MRISSTDSIDGGRVLYPIGKIKAASAWHAAQLDSHQVEAHQGDWRAMALRELIQRAEDVDADAIIGVDYELDRVDSAEQTGVSLRRVLATGIAVKLAVAA